MIPVLLQFNAAYLTFFSGEDRASASAIVFSPANTIWWLVFANLLIVSMALYGLYRYWRHRLLQLHMLRDRIATDLHDDIGSTLSNINMLSLITQKKLDRPEQASQHLKRISEEVAACSQALDDIIWSANARNDNMEETIARMRRYAAELLETGSHVNFRLDMDDQSVTQKLRMEQRRDIYLTYKEALNNIYKHARASMAWISVHVRSNNLQLTIQDNGKGFDMDAPTHRNGLKNMRTRVERWKGRLSIDSGIQQGTLLRIELPIYHTNE